MSSKPPLVAGTGLGKVFGTATVLDDVSLTVPPGTFHAIVGENGAGKSTLAKCLLGFYQPDSGEVRFDGERVTTPADSRRGGAGMVFQHFTLAPSMTVAENLVLAKPELPAVIRWESERQGIREFLAKAPFQVDIDARVEHLAAGQKQKVEILKQLYLRTRLLILDEPTSVLTPAEAGEVLGVVRRLVESGELSVILITHKLREVMTYADAVTVLRRGRMVASLSTKATSEAELARLMVGDAGIPQALARGAGERGAAALEVRGLTVLGANGLPAVKELSLTVRRGEILGVAGISGNGQRELVQAIGGQREREAGEILAGGKAYAPTREGIREAGLYTLPEEPLDNATVPSMSVAENIALRTFDEPPIAKRGFLVEAAELARAAAVAIAQFGVRASSPETAIRNLSGGNVQRAVLARDLGSGTVRTMVVANPCFGLDFAATAVVHNQLMELRNRGGAVLLVSEDLDELMKLADRIVVMSAGRIVHETAGATVDLAAVGRYLGGV